MFKRVYLIILVILMIIPAVIKLGNYGSDEGLRQAQAAYDAGNAAEAAALWHTAATGGSALAQLALGALYASGKGIPRDEVQAVHWYRAAAGQDHPRKSEALCALGEMYLHGRGTAQDYPQALDLFTRAAAAGNPGAMTMLGMMYLNGYGLPRDTGKALEYLNQGAESGDSKAFTLLGHVFEQGLDMPPDPARALRYYEDGAHRDDPEAMLRAGLLLRDGGEGLTPNPLAALAWLHEAARNSDMPAARAALADMVHKASRAKGKALARELAQQALEQGRTYTPDALHQLGLLCELGYGLRPDPVKGYALYTMAASRGMAMATHCAGHLATRLTPEQLKIADAYAASPETIFTALTAEGI